MELYQDVLELIRNRQADVRRVLKQAQPFVRQIEEDHRAAQRAAGADHMDVHDVGHAHQHEDEHLLEDAPKAHGAGQLLVHNGAHDARDVVEHHEYQKRDHQAVHAAHKVPKPAANARNRKLELRPNQINREIPHIVVLP